jgi:hypothetical protein
MNNEQKRRVEEIAEREKKATPGPWIRNDTETYAEIMAENGTIIPFLLTVIAEQEAALLSKAAPAAECATCKRLSTILGIPRPIKQVREVVELTERIFAGGNGVDMERRLRRIAEILKEEPMGNENKQEPAEQPEWMDDNILICDKHSISFTKEADECFVCINRHAPSREEASPTNLADIVQTLSDAIEDEGYTVTWDAEEGVVTLTRKGDAEVDRLVELTTILLDFIDNGGPAAKEWEAISDIGEKLRTAIANCRAQKGSGR